MPEAAFDVRDDFPALVEQIDSDLRSLVLGLPEPQQRRSVTPYRFGIAAAGLLLAGVAVVAGIYPVL